MTRRHTVIDTAVGELTVIAEGESLLGIYFPGHWYLPSADSYGERVEPGGDALFAETRRQLSEYFEGSRTSFDLPFTLAGNELQKQVWAMLTEIPYGETTTYGELAIRLGNRSLSQTVGQAVGHNPLSIVVPCHRVVGHDGRLTGYAGGLERKLFLLELEEPEAAKASKLF